VVAVVAHFAPRYRCGEGVNTVAAQTIHKIWETIENDTLINMIVAG